MPRPSSGLGILFGSSKWLAGWAPVGGSGVGALEGALDRGFAAAAGFVFSAIDPFAGGWVGASRGAAFQAAVGHYAFRGVFQDIERHEALGGGDNLF